MIATARVLVLLLVVLPLAAAVLAPLFGRAARRFSLWMAFFHLAVTAAVVVLTCQVLADRADSPGEPRDVVRFRPEFVPGDTSGPHGAWNRTKWTLLSLTPDPASGDRPGPSIQFFLGLDGLNVWLVALASIVMLPAVLASWDSIKERRGAFYGWLFLMQAGAVGAFLSFDVILFYVFFELTLIPGFFLVGRWGVGSGRRDAARKFFLFTLAGSLLTLVGVIGVVITNPTPVHPRTGTPVSSAVVPVSKPSDPQVPGMPPRLVPEFARPGPVTFSLPDLMGNVQIWANARRQTAELVKSFEAELERVKADALAGPNAVRDAEQRLAEAKKAGVAAAVRDAEQRLAEAKRVEVAVRALEQQSAEAKKVQAEAEQSRLGLPGVQAWLFLALMAGFLVKVPIWPFHTWLPAAYGEAPTGAAILLSALLAKLGTFGILRLVLPLTPDAAVTYGLPVVGMLAAFGIVYAALCAFAQRDLKLLVAYGSVSHLGFLVLGLFAFNPEGLSGAVLHMVNHGLTTAALFAVTGFLVDRYRTTQMSQYGGLMGRFPNFALLTFVLALASIGLPGLNNFVSEMLMLAGLFDARGPGRAGLGPWMAVVAVIGILIGAWYTLTMLQRVFYNPLKEPPAAGPTPPADANGRELFTLGSLAVVCLLLGLFPRPVLDSIRGDADRLAAVGNAARNRVLGVDDPRPQQEMLPTPGNMIPGGGGKGPAPKAGGKGGNPKGGNPKGGEKGKSVIGEEGE